MPSEVGRARQRRLLARLRSLRSSSDAEVRALHSSLEATRLLLHASERDRGERIDELRQSQSRITEVIRQSQSQITELIRQHRAVTESYEQTIQVLRSSVEDLHRKVEYLSTSPGALRVVLGAVLQRVRLYDVLRRHRRLLQRLVPLPAPPGSETAATSSPLAVETPEPARRPSLLEAFLVARSLPGDTTELALERLYHLGSRLKAVLCVHPTARNGQAAYMLASGGADVTALGTGGFLEGLPVAGVTAAWQALGDWLVARGGVLSPFDGILLDAESSEDDERLLRGRLGPECTVIVNAPGHPTSLAPADGESVDGLILACPPPAALRDPAGGEAQYYAQRPWRPEPRRSITLAASLPSGRPWPRISVVTPTLNQGAFLEETLRSVLGQDYPDLEYIVVDGGSSDDTPAILDRYRDRLAHCLTGPDEGQADALNKGFALATGSILAWINSDDRYAAGALWRVALAFDAYGADMVAGGCALARDSVDETTSVHHPALPVGRVVPLPLPRLLDIDGSWIKGEFFYQPEVFWTRELWQGVGGKVAKDLYYSMDYELWLRMAACGARIVHVPDTLAVYRMHKAQKTDGAQPPYLPELRQVVARYRAAAAR